MDESCRGVGRAAPIMVKTQTVYTFMVPPGNCCLTCASQARVRFLTAASNFGCMIFLGLLDQVLVLIELALTLRLGPVH